MGHFIHRWFVALGIFTLVFTGESVRSHAQGMRMMPSQNQVRSAPLNMGFQSPGMGFGINMLSGPNSGFGGMMNGRTYSSGPYRLRGHGLQRWRIWQLRLRGHGLQRWRIWRLRLRQLWL